MSQGERSQDAQGAGVLVNYILSAKLSHGRSMPRSCYQTITTPLPASWGLILAHFTEYGAAAVIAVIELINRT